MWFRSVAAAFGGPDEAISGAVRGPYFTLLRNVLHRAPRPAGGQEKTGPPAATGGRGRRGRWGQYIKRRRASDVVYGPDAPATTACQHCRTLKRLSTLEKLSNMPVLYIKRLRTFYLSCWYLFPKNVAYLTRYSGLKFCLELGLVTSFVLPLYRYIYGGRLLCPYPQSRVKG